MSGGKGGVSEEGEANGKQKEGDSKSKGSLTAVGVVRPVKIPQRGEIMKTILRDIFRPSTTSH